MFDGGEMRFGPGGGDHPTGNGLKAEGKLCWAD